MAPRIGHIIRTLIDHYDVDDPYMELEFDIRHLLNANAGQMINYQTSHVISSLLNRRWTLDDALLVIRRTIDETKKLAGRDSPLSLTDEEYERMLRRAVYRDVQCERANRTDTWSDWAENNINLLMITVLSNVEHVLLLVYGRLTNVEVSQDQPDIDLTSKCVKTRRCRGEDEENSEMCSVCLDQLYQENGMIGMLECGHEYHVECIEKWLLRKSVCPLCRDEGLHGDDIKSNQYIRT